MSNDPDRPTSDPPQAKIIAVSGHWIQTILQTVFAQLIEITIVIGATHAMEMGKLDPTLWLAACGYAAAGGQIARVRGKPIVATTASLALLAIKGSWVLRHLVLVLELLICLIAVQ